MKRKGLLVILVFIFIITACNKPSLPSPPEEKKNPPAQAGAGEVIPIYLNSEEDIKEYLKGQWFSNKETLSDGLLTVSDIDCQMSIDKDLNVVLLFTNRRTQETTGEYLGEIYLDRLYANPNETPDLISIDLGDSDYPGGDFFFKHRTIYDGKQVMSLFFAGNGNCIFDMLADIDNFEYAPEEIIFEKFTGEELNLHPNKDSEFYAVYWGKSAGGKSFWLDEVKWTSTEEYDPEALYPSRMTNYEDDQPGSLLYKIAPEALANIFASNQYAGEVYYVKTDIKGTIIDFKNAEYKEYIDIINDPKS